jgi:hypothetical protein
VESEGKDAWDLPGHFLTLGTLRVAFGWRSRAEGRRIRRAGLEAGDPGNCGLFSAASALAIVEV